MSGHSLKLRAVVAAAVGILLALALVGVGVSLLVARHLNDSLDRTLRQRAVEIAQLSVSAPALLTRPGALDAPIGSRQLSIEVLDRHGRLVARSLALGGRVLDVAPLVETAIRQGRPGYGDVRSSGERLRVYAAPLPEVGGAAARGGAVVVAASTDDIADTIASLRLFLFLAALLAAALAAAAVGLLMRRALRPLSELADAAAGIERTGDPRRRLPEPASADEVWRLAETLNAMLASLERARNSERRFLADASHELRTPLTALRGNVSYLKRHGATEEVIAELDADAERLARLAGDLLALSREEAGEPPAEEVRLDELAREAAASDAAVDVVAPQAVPVRGDREALARALANLVQNARLYGPSEGRITVTADREGGVARLSVSDEGAGLQPYEAERAFERFWRGRRDRPGSGLGLSIVRATAERHGGRVHAEGARVTIELPLLPGEEPPSENPQGQALHHDLSKPR
jgi:two-component system OmpR family sensor kinase